MTVERIGSGGPWEESIGYSRAVAAGPFVFVSGCTAMVEGTVVGEGDPYLQMRTALSAAERALAQLGVGLGDVVQTRMYVTHIGDQEHVGRAHREVLGEVRPATIMVEVAGLIDSRMLVEVEVVAYRGGG